jgi:hypothetical protein
MDRYGPGIGGFLYGISGSSVVVVVVVNKNNNNNNNNNFSLRANETSFI